MAAERFAPRDESYGGFFNCKAPPVVSERHTIIEDYRGVQKVQFLYSSPMAARKVIINPADQYSYATREEYHGSNWPKTTATSKPPLPHPPRVYYPPVSQMGRKPINCDEAAKRFGGIVITEYRNKK